MMLNSIFIYVDFIMVTVHNDQSSLHFYALNNTEKFLTCKLLEIQRKM